MILPPSLFVFSTRDTAYSAWDNNHPPLGPEGGDGQGLSEGVRGVGNFEVRLRTQKIDIGALGQK